jgi:uncharacterized protein (DUF433 family)
MNTCSEILIDPEIQGGNPVFKGTRVTIDILYQYIESGDTIDSFLLDFPGVTKQQAIAVLEYSKGLALSA